jgi:UPF0176 protein
MKALHNKINNQLLKTRMASTAEARKTLSFYCYHHLQDPQAFRNELYAALSRFQVFGRIYIASEGINAQISVPECHFEAFRDSLYSISWLNGVRLNVAVEDDGRSFYKLTIKVRPKIVADGLEDKSFDVTRRGKALDAKSFNELTEHPDTIIVDMRNHYESEVGYFKGAIRPDAETFREALPIVGEMLQEHKEKPIVMYCTGGIRCEKASAYMLHQGYHNVYMVDGGIIQYARQCEEASLENKFIGKNFVFDERLGERISPEIVAHCHQCGAPCDTHKNCANDACHILFIQCQGCAAAYHHCCSAECAEFHQLPVEEQQAQRGARQFNGSKFGKSRYKAPLRGEGLSATTPKERP